MKDFWPPKIVHYVPLYWHFTLMFCLPYFGVSMCLFTSCAWEWVLDLILIIFVLAILVDWKTYAFTLFLGAVVALTTFIMAGDWQNFDPHLSNLPMTIYALFVAIISGVLFSRHKEMVLLEKLKTFEGLATTIAHEMRTPFSAINVSSAGLSRCLPVLLQSYRRSVEHDLIKERIPQLTLDSMANLPQRFSYICINSLNMIEMLLLQLKDGAWRSHFENCCIKECLGIVMSEYSFRDDDERKLVVLDDHFNFKFFGNSSLVVHIIYNLLRNAMVFIRSERKGQIFISTGESAFENHLYFKDTAKGISDADLPHIFEHGFSRRSGGSGVGLHYCRRMMIAMGGNINVTSKLGEFCEFRLSFPKNFKPYLKNG